MNKWKSYLNRWTPGKGRKEGKKGLTQASLSLEPPDVSGRSEDLSALRNSISLDPNMVSPSDIIEEILAHKTIDSPPIENHEPHGMDPEAEERSTPGVSPTMPECHPTDGMPIRARITFERRDSAPTSDLFDYLPMNPASSSSRPFPPLSTDSIQTPLAVPPPSVGKPRQTTDGYIPLDTCSSGKRIASFKLEQEQRFNNQQQQQHHHQHQHHYIQTNSFSTDHVETHPTRPSLPTKDLYFLESVPPIPSHSHFHEKLPCPPLSSRGKIHNSHSVACDGDSFPQHQPVSWTADKRDLRNFHHNSFHFFSDRCHRNKMMTSHDFGDYVACDSNNNNNNNNNNSNDFNQQESVDDRGYYNDAIGSLQRYKQKRYHGSVSPSLLDRDSKELLRRPVPPPRSAFNRYHSYANEPRSNSFKRHQNPSEGSKTFVDSYNSLRRQKELEDFEREIRELHPIPRMVHKKTIVSRTHRAPCSDDADSLDGSSSYSNEETGSISDFMPSSDEPFNSRFAPRIKSVSRSMYDGKPRPNVEIKYLQLSLQQTPEDASWTTSNNKVEPEHVSNYKEIDWLKTEALQKTMQQLMLEQGSKEMNL